MSEQKREIRMEELNSILPNEGWKMEEVHAESGVDLRTPENEVVFAPWSMIVDMENPGVMETINKTAHETTDCTFYGRCLQAIKDSQSE